LLTRTLVWNGNRQRTSAVAGCCEFSVQTRMMSCYYTKSARAFARAWSRQWAGRCSVTSQVIRPTISVLCCCLLLLWFVSALLT